MNDSTFRQTDGDLADSKSASRTQSAKRKPKHVPTENVPTEVENGAAELVESQSRQLLTAIVAFRDGDFSKRLPDDWHGTFGLIADAFNQTISHEDRISRDIAKLSVTVGKEGRLGQRISLQGTKGGWVDKLSL